MRSFAIPHVTWKPEALKGDYPHCSAAYGVESLELPQLSELGPLPSPPPPDLTTRINTSNPIPRHSRSLGDRLSTSTVIQFASLPQVHRPYPTQAAAGPQHHFHHTEMQATKHLLQQQRQPMIRFLGKRTTPTSP